MAKIGIRAVALTFALLLLCSPLMLYWGRLLASPVLTFISGDTGNKDVYFLDSRTRHYYNFSQTPTLDEWSFLWSRDGQQIILVAPTDGGDLLTLTDANGRNPQSLNPITRQVFNLTWSADKQYLAYFSSYQNTSDLYLISVPTNTTTLLTDTPSESETFPDWSPRGSDLLFFMDGDMLLAHTQSGILERLTDTLMAEEYPVWSPDGSQIAYQLTDRLSGQRQLYVITPANRHIQQLETVIAPRALPVAWSPDSHALTLTLDSQQIVTLDIASGVTQALTDGSRRTWGPVWSPDGRLIAYIENRHIRIHDLHLARIIPLDFEMTVQSSLIWKP